MIQHISQNIKKIFIFLSRILLMKLFFSLKVVMMMILQVAPNVSPLYIIDSYSYTV